MKAARQAPALILVAILAWLVPTSACANPAPRPTGVVPSPAPTPEQSPWEPRAPRRGPYAMSPVVVRIEAAGRTFHMRGIQAQEAHACFIPVTDSGTQALFSLYETTIRWVASQRAALVEQDQERWTLGENQTELCLGERQVRVDFPLLVHEGVAYLPVALLPHLLPGRLQALETGHYAFDPLVSALDLEAPEGGGVRLTITSRVPMKCQTFMLRHPNRYVLNIPHAVLDLDRYHEVGDRVLRHAEVGDIRFDQFSFKPNVVRVVIPLGSDGELRVLPRSTPRRLVVAIVKPSVQPHEVDLSNQTITDVTWQKTQDGLRITMKGTGPFQYEWHRLHPPDNRFFLDLPKTVLAGPRRHFEPRDPYVSAIQVGQYQKDPTPTVRLLLELEKTAETRISTPSDMPNTLVLDVHHHGVTEKAPVYQGYGTTQTAATRGRVICIDPGHGGSDPGAMNRSLGLAEKNITLDVSRRLAAVLRAAGWRVVMTRNSDRDLTYPGSSGSEELGARVRVAVDFRAELFISIHCNASVNTAAMGTSTHWYKASDRQLASDLHPRIVEAIGCPSRGLIRNRFYVLAHSPLPSVLIETAYISNTGEARKLADPEQRQRLAEGIAEGLKAYVARGGRVGTTRSTPAGAGGRRTAAPRVSKSKGPSGRRPAQKPRVEPVVLRPTSRQKR